MRHLLALLLLLASPALAQTPGTLNLSGPSTGGPVVTTATINGAVNAQLGAKADAVNPVFTGNLTLTGNATMGGTLGATGAGAIGGTLTLGAGGAGGQRIQASGTGNWTFQPGGASSVFNFTSSGGTSLLQIGSAANQVTSETQLVLKSNTDWTTSSLTGSTPLQNSQTLTGTFTGAGAAFLGFRFNTTDSIVATSVGAVIGDLTMSVGAGAVGPRHPLNIKMSQTATTQNLLGVSSGTYDGIDILTQMLSNDNGTGLTPSTSHGAMSAINPVTHWGPLATFTSGGSGAEIDLYAETGSSMMDKIGLLVDLQPLDRVQAARDDIAIAIDKSSASTPGWLEGISFGRQGGSFGVAATGTLISGVGNGGAGFTVARGVDWSLGTFTGNAWNDGHTKLTGDGEIIAAKITDPASAPGAASFKLTVVAGTNAGSCKLIARAGTSATPVTIIDNVGSGC